MKPLYARELGKGKFAGWMVVWYCRNCDCHKSKYGDEDDEDDRDYMYSPPSTDGCPGPDPFDGRRMKHDWIIEDELDGSDPDEM